MSDLEEWCSILTSDKKLTLVDVLHILHICKNLVFDSLLSKAGFKLVFEVNKFALTKNSQFIGKKIP